MKNIITNRCSINDGRVIKNGEVEYSAGKVTDFRAFMKEIYKHYGIDYPNFYKMDELSKLAFLTAEILLYGRDINKKYKSNEIGVVIANSTSTASTDLRYIDTIKDKENYFPNPSIFVYTLPNIMIGEICIRHGLKGETALFVTEKFDKEFLCHYVNNLMDNGRINCAVCGYVDFKKNRDDDSFNYESTLYLFEKII